MYTPLPIVKVFELIVQEVEDNILADLQLVQPKIEKINYQYGHPIEIIETLVQYDKHPSKRFEKYPLVMLIQDFDVNNGTVDGYYGEANLRLIIAHHTKKDYKAKERYNATFEPILYPIYSELMQVIADSRYFVTESADTIRHTAKDRLYWGRESLNAGNTANAFCDYLDAIEITNLRLTIDNAFCTFYINP